jgi:hypothetical protein
VKATARLAASLFLFDSDDHAPYRSILTERLVFTKG